MWVTLRRDPQNCLQYKPLFRRKRVPVLRLGPNPNRTMTLLVKCVFESVYFSVKTSNSKRATFQECKSEHSGPFQSVHSS